MTEHLLWARLCTGHAAKETFSNRSEPWNPLCRGHLGGKSSGYSRYKGELPRLKWEGVCCPGLSPCPQPAVSQGKSKQPEDWPCGALHASLTAQSRSVKEVLRSPLGRGDH